MAGIETHRRSLMKAISYRMLGTIVTALIAFVITDTVDSAVKIGFADLVFKIFAFYAHERIWQLLPFGKAAPIDYEI